MNNSKEENLNYIKVKLNEMANNCEEDLYNKYKGIMKEFSKIIKEIFDKLNENNRLLNSNQINNESNTNTRAITGINNSNSNNNTNNRSGNNIFNRFYNPNNFEEVNKNGENEKKYIKLLTYYSIEVLFLILSYGNIFISDSKKTSKITFDFFCENIEYFIKLYNKEIVFSIFNKIFFIYKNFDKKVQEYYLKKFKELFKILEGIIDKNDIKQDKIIIYNKYKNKIDSFTSLKNSEDFILFKSEKNISFVPIINLRDDIKNFFNEPKILINTLEELDKESQIIKELNEKHEEIIFKGCCELNKQYLYIFKKIMDKIDKMSANPNIVIIFFNIIFRSTTFIKYLQKSFIINTNNIIPREKEIFIEKYFKIGKYLYDMYIKPINPELLKKFDQCVENHKTKIYDIIDNFCNKQENIIRNYDKIFSEFHSFIYKIMLSDSEYQRPFSFLVFNLKMKKHEFKLLYEEFKNYKIQNLFMNDENDYFQFQSKVVEDRETISSFENDEGYVEICNVLGRILFSDPININLFIIIKIWAYKYEISNDFKKDNENKLFDDSLILYFIYLFLIQIGEIRLFKQYIDVDRNGNLKYKVNLNDLNKSYEKNLLYKGQGSKLDKIGKLFIDFLYFILQLIETSKILLEKDNQYLIVSLNSFSFTKNNIKEEKIKKSQKKQLELMDIRDMKDSKIFYVYTSFNLKYLNYIVTKTLNNLLVDDNIQNIFSFTKIEDFNKINKKYKK